VVSEHRRTGDRSGHHRDGSARDQETEVHGDAEAAHPRTVAAQHGAPLQPGHPARLERTGGEFERDESPCEESAEHDRECRADHGDESQ
jgi:hypothetical protein